MKKIFLAIIASFLSVFSFQLMAETISADDARVTYVGRTLVQDHSVSFDWTATYCRLAFSGKKLTLRASDMKWDATPEAAAKRHNYYAIWINSPTSADPHRIIEVLGNDTTIELIDPAYLKKSRRAVHEVVIQKRTEGEQGKTTFHSFSTDGQFFPATPLKTRQLEFIGDSYTCGYGVDAPSRKERFSPETENASRSYAAIVSRYFDADYVSISHSGMGIARNYNSKFKGWWMPDRYLQTFDEDSTSLTRWDATRSDFHPAMTIVYLGANDFSTALAPKYEDFRKHYYRLFSYIKANYGEDHPILCVATKTHEYLFNYVRDLVNNCDMSNIHYLGYCPAQHLHTDEDLGADVHPNYNGQQKKAYSIIPYIATITGWGLQDMPVK
jgi:lysophospholipase L1-like esterase